METEINFRNLISVLAAQHPTVVTGDGFLDRIMFVEGLCFSTSNSSLRSMFCPFGDVEAAVLVRDGDTGERAGLVVFTDSDGCSAATSIRSFPLCHRKLTKASEAGVDPLFVEKALQEAQRKRPMAERLASMLPPSYLDSNAVEDIHFRCLFLLLNEKCCKHEDGALHVYKVACEIATGNVSAVVLCEPLGLAAVVFDEAADTEMVARMSRRLLGNGVTLYDSSLFPIRAGTGAAYAGSMLQLLPVFCHHSQYRGRVVIFRGFDTQDRHRDAGVITEGVQWYLETFHRLQALLVHRAQGLVLAVLGSREEALSLVEQIEHDWAQAFGQAISCELMDVDEFPTKLRASALEFFPQPDVLEDATSIVKMWLQSYLRGCATANDTKGIVRGLIARTALSKPHLIRETRFGAFADRVVLLWGVSDTITMSKLKSVMLPIGGFDCCEVFSDKRVALLVFRSANLATRVLNEPMERWLGSGFSDCQLAPGADDACMVADCVLARRIQAVDWVYSSRTSTDDPEQREACVRILELIDGDVSDLTSF